jgi:hypothetical protein
MDMLTTATMVMPLGTDPVNVRHASAEQTDTADISFAKSFEESSGLTVTDVPQPAEKNVQGLDGIAKIASAIEPKAVADFPDAKMKQGGKTADEIQKDFVKTTNQLALASGKAMSSLAGVATPSTAISAHSGKAKDLSPVPEAKLSVGQRMVESKSDDVKSIDQKSTPPIVETETDAVDATVDLGADEVSSAEVEIASSGVKAHIEDSKGAPLLEKSLGAVVTEKESTGHDGLVKTRKLDNKEEKKAAVAVLSSAGVDVQSAVAAMVVVAPVDGTKSAPTAVADEDVLPSVSPLATGSGIVAAKAKAGARDKGPEIVNKSDSDNGKTTGPILSDDSAAQKSEIKESKIQMAATKPAVTDNAAAQSAVWSVAVGGTAHVETGTAGVCAVISGGAAAHVVAAGSVQATVSSPHAATVLASTATDSGAGVDTGHKTLIATSTSLEVGVANGTHGWLKIRADITDGGVVNASLSTATSSGQEMLHRELPSLTAYLQSERVAVNTLVVQPAMTPGVDLRDFQGAMAGDGRGLAQQNGGQGGENRQGASDSRSVQVEREGFYSGRNGVGREEGLTLATRAGGGNWLNVRA